MGAQTGEFNSEKRESKNNSDLRNVHNNISETQSNSEEESLSFNAHSRKTDGVLNNTSADSNAVSNNIPADSPEKSFASVNSIYTPILDKVNSPDDLKKLDYDDLPKLSDEIRHILIHDITHTGGHLGSNLGIVELTIAIHRIFNSPEDSIIFDTGHQTYVHKILTGRKDFTDFKTGKGLSGYPSRQESIHDIVENSHASTGLSWANGISEANHLLDNDNATTVVVCGDGAMTGGMSFEGINNISQNPDRNLVIVINDNKRSYSPTVGGLAKMIQKVSINRNYHKHTKNIKNALKKFGIMGDVIHRVTRAAKEGVKEAFIPYDANDGLSVLGIPYIGPLNGHDILDIEKGLYMAKNYKGITIVHVITEKGHGYKLAEDAMTDHFHVIGKINAKTGKPVNLDLNSEHWSKVFGNEILNAAKKNKKIVGVTAAMMVPVGLKKFYDNFPERIFDVGIAEEHALTFAAGLAYKGFHPFIALYSTFSYRAFDQMLMDVSLHNAGVTLVLDRGGITGTDGASHNGILDISLFGILDNVYFLLPRNKETLIESIHIASNINNAPSVIRYPKTAIPDAESTKALCQIDSDCKAIKHDVKNYSDPECFDLLYTNSDADFYASGNGISGKDVAVSDDSENNASGTSASRSGDSENNASGTSASRSGDSENNASGTSASENDGSKNSASGTSASENDGSKNSASGTSASKDDNSRKDDSTGSDAKNDNQKNILFVCYGDYALLGKNSAVELDKLCNNSSNAGKENSGNGSALTSDTYKITVVNPLYAFPVANSLINFAKNFDYVVTLENGISKSGVGIKLSQKIYESDYASDRIDAEDKNSKSTKDIKFVNLGVDKTFLETATVEEIEEKQGLTPKQIAQKIYGIL